MSAGVGPLVGIFVGGRATRMGGRDKTRARRADGRPLVEYLATAARDAYGETPVVLVGSRGPGAESALPTLSDDPPGVGPLGGLAALLARGADDERDVVALAGDMPFITAALLRRLVQESAGADAVAPRPGGIWQPLCAWYRAPAALDVTRAALDGDRRALRAVLEGLGARARVLDLDAEELQAMRDWDTPEQVRRDGGSL